MTWTKDLRKLVDPWPASTFATRMYDCVFMLSVHGAITESESLNIKRRIQKILEQRAGPIPEPEEPK